MKPAHAILLLPMLVYVCVAIAWHEQGVNPITGDEPHYLLTAESLIRDGDLLVVNNHLADTPVLREMPPGASLGDTHSYNGYSMHGPGLPLLLAPAYALAGVLGAKLLMALLIGLAPLAIYRLARQVLGDAAWAIALAVMLGLGQPFVTASNQIYPDLLSGLIVFALLIRWHRPEGPPALGSAVLESLLMALLPWLHVKLALPTAILYAFAMRRALGPGHRIRHPIGPAPLQPGREGRAQGRAAAWAISLIVGASLIGLGAYHLAAFQSVAGPYQRADATADPRQIGMILTGLHLDRMQGLFAQAPLLLLGVFGIAFFAAESGPLFVLAALLYLSVMIPNAAHTNWYGGFSFAGRFHWFGALLWCFPLLYAVRYLRVRRAAWLIGGITLIALPLQIIFLSKVLIPNAAVYNLALSPAASWMEGNPYADFLDLAPLERARFLPSFRDFETYAVAPANWVAVGLALCLLAGGYGAMRGRGRMAALAGAAFLACSLATLWLAQPPIRPLALRPILAGGQAGGNAEPPAVAGPLVPLRPGLYAIQLEYDVRGYGYGSLRWDWLRAGGSQAPVPLAAGTLPLGQGQPRRLLTLGMVPRGGDDALFGVRLQADGGLRVTPRRLMIWPLRDP